MTLSIKDEKLNHLITDSGKGEILEDENCAIDNKKLLRKLDWHLIPGVTVLYLLSFIDRGNIGNAKIEGLATDLNLVGNQFNIVLTCFYLTYSPFELPSNYLIMKLKPHIYLPALMVAWGIVITLTGLVQSYQGLIVARIFLGIAEAGLFPGVAYYLTRWYGKREIQYRQALFYAAASIAGAFSGLLAYGIGFMDGIGGQAGWRWIFYLEGIATVIIALLAYFFIYDYPEDASFLTEEERVFVMNKLLKESYSVPADSGEVFVEVDEPTSKRVYILEALKDWQWVCHWFVHMSVVTTIYALSVFLPTIIKSMGYTAAHAQLMSVPPYVCASVLTILIAKLADKFNLRSPVIFACYILEIIGYGVAMGMDVKTHPKSVYGGIFLVTAASFVAFPAMISWLAINVEGKHKRGVSMALQIGLGNMSGAYCVNFFRAQDAPRYLFGYGMELMFIGMGIIAMTIINVAYWRINKQRAADIASGKYNDVPLSELVKLGDRSPYFKYSH